MVSKYNYEQLQLIQPDFGSSLTSLIIELEHLRKKRLVGTTEAGLFFQLKEIFHFLESLESARIEGNRTTLAELVDKKIGSLSAADENFLEIDNLEKAIEFAIDHLEKNSISKSFICELHKIVVGGLSPQREGDATPGQHRKTNVQIAKASHIPPDYVRVEDYMEELINFINESSDAKYDLLKTALAHHRFMWIHPFRNGNGRVGRLLTYSMLVKQGFNVKVGRILNPTAIFCTDRNKYYDYLSKADSGEKIELLNWCEYVLSGLKLEIEKIDNLLNHEYLAKKILLPSISFALERQSISPVVAKILEVAATEQIFEASHLKKIFPGKASSEVSRQIRMLREKKLVIQHRSGPRKYQLSFYNNFLLRGVVEMLGKNGFIPVREAGQ